ncbi:amino acid/polyamine transporter I [Diaporthe sp. PMI_573]|nr:amino acid/polyamine transporter I [Diaporthaceae sp. PMI_573]
MVVLAFNVCNSWTAVATTLAIAISAGGTFTVLYGMMIVSVVYVAVALPLAELASVYPTAGGQYHFASILAPKRFSRGISYACGVAATCSWVFLAAGVTTLASQLILALPAYYVQGYDPKIWHYFLIFQAINIFVLAYNIFVLKKAPWTHEIGFILTLLTFATVSITCLACSTKQPSSFVWANFSNNTGWPAGITFLTGLATPAIMFAGLDGAMHMADECIHPAKVIPKALLSTVGMGIVTGLGFGIAMCYGITDLDALVNTTMPIYDLWRQSTKSPTAATVFLVALLCIVFFAINAMVQTASRLTSVFALDGGLLGGHYLSHVDPKLGVPVRALVANAVVIFVLGCIYLGSITAFNAIMGSAIILQMISFAITAFLLIVQKRPSTLLPPNRSFKMPDWLGWVTNFVVVAFAIVELVFFNFPPAIPVSGSSMNYASIVLVVTAIVAILNWMVHATIHYEGPRTSV